MTLTLERFFRSIPKTEKRPMPNEKAMRSGSEKIGARVTARPRESRLGRLWRVAIRIDTLTAPPSTRLWPAIDAARQLPAGDDEPDKTLASACDDWPRVASHGVGRAG